MQEPDTYVRQPMRPKRSSKKQQEQPRLQGVYPEKQKEQPNMHISSLKRQQGTWARARKLGPIFLTQSSQDEDAEADEGAGQAAKEAVNAVADVPGRWGRVPASPLMSGTCKRGRQKGICLICSDLYWRKVGWNRSRLEVQGFNFCMQVPQTHNFHQTRPTARFHYGPCFLRSGLLIIATFF